MDKLYCGIYKVSFTIRAEDEDDLKEQIEESISPFTNGKLELYEIYVDEVTPYEEWEDNYGN